MTLTLNLAPTLDLPVWEGLNPSKASNAAGAQARYCRIPGFNLDFGIFMCNSTSNIYEYQADTDTPQVLPASGMSGTFGAGASAYLHPHGPSGTASGTGADNTKLPTPLTITRDLRGHLVRILSGPGAGNVRRIKSNTTGANAVITVDTAFSATITTSSTFLLLTGSVFVWCPHTASTWAYMSVWDRATNVWTARAVPGTLAAAWGTDAQLRGTAAAYFANVDSSAGKTFTCTTAALTVTAGASWKTDWYARGVFTVLSGTGAGQVRLVASNTAGVLTFDTALTTALDASSTWIVERVADSNIAARGTITHTNTTNATITITNAIWYANNWCNWQVRVVAGTGAGQTKQITSNTTTTLTLSGVWTTALAADSVWVIEPWDDALYIQGNNSVTAYRYTRAGNTWAALAPTAARAAAPGAGASLSWVHSCQDDDWSVLSTTVQYLNGCYFYSFRGGNSANLDVLSINGGTAGATTWTSGKVYGGSGEAFNTGTSWEYDDRDNIYGALADGRVMRLDIPKNALFSVATIDRTQGTATVGDKLFNVQFIRDGKRLDYLYHWRNSAQEVSRLPLWLTYGV